MYFFKKKIWLEWAGGLTLTLHLRDGKDMQGRASTREKVPRKQMAHLAARAMREPGEESANMQARREMQKSTEPQHVLYSCSFYQAKFKLAVST